MTHIDLPSIWLLERPHESVRYDENNGFIITAPDEWTARQIAASNAGDEGPSTWTIRACSSCTLIGIANDPTPRLILRSFNAG